MHKKALTVAVAGALVAPIMAQAEVTISGQVNRALVVTEDASTFQDGSNAGTRFRIRMAGEEMDGLSAGINLEWGVKDSDHGDHTDPKTTDSDNFNQRHRNLWIKGGFGEIRIGHTSDASDFVSYQDKSGVHVGHGKQGASGWFTFGGRRKDGLHFTSSSVGGGKAHFSLMNDDLISASVEVSNADAEEPVISYKGALGYLDEKDQVGYGGAIGVAHASGLTASVSAGSVSYDNDDPTDTYTQGVLGYMIGSSAVAVGLYNGDKKGDGANDSDTTIIGIGVKHSLKAGVELYATAHNSETGDTDASVFVLGAKVNF